MLTGTYTAIWNGSFLICSNCTDVRFGIFASGDLMLVFVSLLVATFRLLIAFANSLDPDQDRQNVGPDLVPNRLTL